MYNQEQFMKIKRKAPISEVSPRDLPTYPVAVSTPISILTFWRRIFFFQILAHPVFKMWVIQKTNKVALRNKRHFEEKKMEIIQHV